ncbi:hypothetical protein ACVGWX_00785, partial [Enterobacter hormaechei]
RGTKHKYQPNAERKRSRHQLQTMSPPGKDPIPEIGKSAFSHSVTSFVWHKKTTDAADKTLRL